MTRLFGHVLSGLVSSFSRLVFHLESPTGAQLCPRAPQPTAESQGGSVRLDFWCHSLAVGPGAFGGETRRETDLGPLWGRVWAEAWLPDILWYTGAGAQGLVHRA